MNREEILSLAEAYNQVEQQSLEERRNPLKGLIDSIKGRSGRGASSSSSGRTDAAPRTRESDTILGPDGKPARVPDNTPRTDATPRSDAAPSTRNNTDAPSTRNNDSPSDRNKGKGRLKKAAGVASAAGLTYAALRQHNSGSGSDSSPSSQSDGDTESSSSSSSSSNSSNSSSSSSGNNGSSGGRRKPPSDRLASALRDTQNAITSERKAKEGSDYSGPSTIKNPKKYQSNIGTDFSDVKTEQAMLKDLASTLFEGLPEPKVHWQKDMDPYDRRRMPGMHAPGSPLPPKVPSTGGVKELFGLAKKKSDKKDKKA